MDHLTKERLINILNKLFPVVVGVLLGALLSQLWHYQNETRFEEKLRKAVQIEVDLNLEILAKLKDDLPRIWDLRRTHTRKRKVEALEPQWNFLIWEKNIASAATAFESPFFKKCVQFYKNLSKIDYSFNEIQKSIENNQDDYTGDSIQKCKNHIEEAEKLADIIKVAYE